MKTLNTFSSPLSMSLSVSYRGTPFTRQLIFCSDTKLIAKSILPSITQDAKSLQANSAGRRTLLYPLVPRDRRYYTPSMIARISETDGLRAHTSKKSSDIRGAEICSAASSELLSWVVRDGAEVSRETGGSLVITEIMLEAHGGESRLSTSVDWVTQSVAQTKRPQWKPC